MTARGFLPIQRQESRSSVWQLHLGQLCLVLKFALMSLLVLSPSLLRRDSAGDISRALSGEGSLGVFISRSAELP